MIHIKHEYIGDIPCLIIEKKKNEIYPLPFVLYLHGFGREKEDGLTLAYLLARQNIRVVLPDSLYHGENKRDLISEEEVKLHFLDIINQNIKDIQLIKDYFTAKDLIKNSQIGLAGMSMGGITTAAALTQYEWVTSSGLLMGTPNIKDFAKLLIEQQGGIKALGISESEYNQIMKQLKKIDLSQNSENLKDHPIFMWHGTSDEVIPVNYVREFYKKLKVTYKDPSYIKLVEEEKRGHYLSYRAIQGLVKWFVDTLKPQES